MTCVNCRHYHELEASGLDEERIFPGRGECWYNPPVALMDPAGRVITARPEVLGIESCVNYTAKLTVTIPHYTFRSPWWWGILPWFKAMRSRLKFDRYGETGGGEK